MTEVAALQDALLGGNDSTLLTTGRDDSWLSGGNPTDADNSSLELESSFLMREGREPSHEEIIEYLEKHKLQAFMTDVVMHVARHFPPDPFEFLLDHIEAMVMKRRAGNKAGATDTKMASKAASPPVASPLPADLSEEKRRSVTSHVVMALRHDGVTRNSAEKMFDQFADGEMKLGEAEFVKLLTHLEATWGLQPDDKKLMMEALRRWRFRSNAARGTRGLPLWPVSRDDFALAYPSMLRCVRDRYVPIGSGVHRSLFIKKAMGELTDKYTIGTRLGRGAFGEVLLVILQSTGEKRVCKRVARNQQQVPDEELQNEVELLRGLDHPHIIRLFEFYEEETHLDMIMEPVFGGTLTALVQGLYQNADGDLIKQRPAALQETWVATCFAQLLSALKYAHEVAGVIHKDLKTDNVLLVGKPKLGPLDQLKEPVHAMLADFGIAEVFSAAGIDQAAAADPHNQEELHSSAGGGHGVSLTGTRPSSTRTRSNRVGGTPPYMSPEMFKGSFTEKSDIWSLGVMAYQMMTGEMPYRGDNILMQMHVVCNPRRHPAWELLSNYKWSLGARWFCQQLLSKDEGMRPTADEALRDNWLTKTAADHGNESPADSERQALQEQHLQSHLMKMAMACVTSQLSLSQMHHLNARFEHYDGSGDGRLSHVEMRQVLEDVGISKGEDLELIIESLDSDHSGLIEYSEFIAGCTDLATGDVKDHLKVVFGIFDLDGSGSISFNELRQVLTAGPNAGAAATRPSSPAKAAEMLPDGKTPEEVMKELDRDQTGKVDYVEFEKYLLGEHERVGQQLHAEQATVTAGGR